MTKTKLDATCQVATRLNLPIKYQITQQQKEKIALDGPRIACDETTFHVFSNLVLREKEENKNKKET